MIRNVLVGLAVGVLALAGCASNEEQDSEPIAKSVPVPVDSGKVNPALVGGWLSPDKITTLTFGEDGKYTAVSDGTVDTHRIGTMKVSGKSQGKWSEKAGMLMMRAEDGLETSYTWTASADGKSVDLKAKRSPKPSHYTRVAPIPKK